jgi:hypothetical protein
MTGLNRDQINKLIFDNELFHGVLTGMGVVMDIDHLEKFTELVAAIEREACAKLVEEWGDPIGASLQIRARGQG